jgi:hypothetical protein
MDVWRVCASFCVCVVLCLGRGLATSWSPVQGVLPSVNYQETEKSALCSKKWEQASKWGQEEVKKNLTLRGCVSVHQPICHRSTPGWRAIQTGSKTKNCSAGIYLQTVSTLTDVLM